MLLVLVGGLLIHRSVSKEVAPSRDFVELEFAGADTDHTGSCYSLSTVLIAYDAFSGATRTWTPAGEDAWTLKLETVTQSYNGPEHEFQNFTFEKVGKQARLKAVEASQGRSTDIEKNVDALLDAPDARRSTPVDRCREPGASGYRYKPRK